MSASDRQPSVVKLSELPRERIDGADAWLARLISKGEHGADFVLGLTWLSVGGCLTFDLDKPGEPVAPQEAYFVLRGCIEVDWGDDATLVQNDEAVYFPPGRAYTVTAVGNQEAMWVYVAIPPPR